MRKINCIKLHAKKLWQKINYGKFDVKNLIGKFDAENLL